MPNANGGLFSAFVCVYFTPDSGTLSTAFLPFFIHRLDSAREEIKKSQKSGIFIEIKKPLKNGGLGTKARQSVVARVPGLMARSDSKFRGLCLWLLGIHLLWFIPERA